MAVLRWPGVFDAIEADVGRRLEIGRQDVPFPAGRANGLPLSWEQAREECSRIPAERAGQDAQDALWRTVIRGARQGGADGQEWALYGVWLAIPAMRGTARRVVARLRADRGDVESAMVLGLLEELTETDPDGTDLGRRLLRAARRSGWESARSGREAVPVADIASLRSARPCPDGQEGTVSPACGEPCTAKSADHVLSPREIEGMRLGALAQRMLLGSVVVASVHRNRGVVTGSLRLARGRAGRGGAKEPGCGGHRREQR